MDKRMKGCMKRLIKDLEELKKSPVENVSAVPLEDNMLEWHCNIRQKDIIFHLILFFPPEYPCKPPSAEFVPRGFGYGQGATRDGRKGTQICLNIFSDFADAHNEWASQRGNGWSPGYTVQMVLMNVISFLVEHETVSGILYSRNLSLSKSFTCSDCGHSYETPFPSLLQVPDTKEEEVKVQERPVDTDENLHLPADAQPVVKAEEEPDRDREVKNKNAKSEMNVIIDYISKETFDPTSDQQEGENLFGFGLISTGARGRAKLTTPCEFLTARTFYDMKEIVGVVHSVQREELQYFLPLFIDPKHGFRVRKEFERTMRSLSEDLVVSDGIVPSIEDMVLKTLPNLMCGTVVGFVKGTQYTSENSLNGYFALHRLFLWALDTYPTLQAMLEDAIRRFVEEESNRGKSVCPDIGQWLMLLSGSRSYRWLQVSSAYLQECQRRNVMWYVKEDPNLKDLDLEPEYRLEQTFKQTVVSRNLLAFQVSFLDVAMPDGMSRAEIIQRYDHHLGFPTQDMVSQMKLEYHKIKTQIQTFADWYSILKLPVPTDLQMHESLVDAVQYAFSHHGYYFR